jgi:glycosyltransferase involved in cell wall biosynthesis
VLLVVGGLGRGGAEQQLVLQAGALRSAGIDVAVLTLTAGEALEADLRATGVTVEHLRAGAGPLGRAARAAVAARRHHPDVVQATHAFANPYAAVAARACGGLGVGALRGGLADLHRSAGRWHRAAVRWPHGIIANSTAGADELRSSGLLPRERVAVVPNVIDLDRFDRRAAAPGAVPPIAAGRTTVALVARLVPVKRIDRFVRALAEARATAPELAGIVVGDGPERGPAEELARSLGQGEDDCRFLGERDDVPHLLRGVAALAVTSDDEGSPNVILEAMAAAVPVMSFPVGDAAALLGEAGTIVGDTAALAQALVDLARRPEPWAARGAEGRQRVRERHATDRAAAQLAGAWAALAGVRGIERGRRPADLLGSEGRPPDGPRPGIGAPGR